MPLPANDRDFLRHVGSEEEEEQDETSATEAEETSSADVSGTSDENTEVESDETEAESSSDSTEADESEDEDLADASDEDFLKKVEAPSDSKYPDTPGSTEEKVTDPESTSTEPNYKEFYEKVMAPLRANGKTIELQSPEEAIKLMSMGANYTKRMQELAPHRKLLLMLEKNELLNEEKLAFLIDLHSKEPAAIKKYFRDANIDPLDVDVTADTEYTGSSHIIDDKEIEFRSALDNLHETPGGLETSKHIVETWDRASKTHLASEPALLALIHEQRTNGVYALITAEMERQKVLGNLPVETPFLTAYEAVGRHLAGQGAFEHIYQNENQTQNRTQSQTPSQARVPAKPQVRQPVAVRPSRPTRTSTARNSERVAAAAPSRTAPTSGTSVDDTFKMADDEFMRFMKGKL